MPIITYIGVPAVSHFSIDMLIYNQLSFDKLGTGFSISEL